MKVMESTSTKLDVIKPVFLKAGIPLAIAAAGFVFARITRRKCTDFDSNSPSENQIHCGSEDLESLDSSYLSCFDFDHSSSETSQQDSEGEAQCHPQIQELEAQVLVLRSQVKDLRVRELELEIQYLHYRDSKGQELVVMELEKMLLLEITRAQVLDMDISAEAERQRFQKMVVEYQKILALLQVSRSSNRMLQMRIKRLLRKSKEQRQLIREQYKQIEAKGAENSRSQEELVAKTEIIRKLEDENQEQKTTLSRLQEEKNDLSNQIELANRKIEAENVNMEENFSQVPSTLEKLETERATETEELIYLRWSNACLRHELMKKNQEDEDAKQGKNPEEEVKLGEIAYFGSDDDEHERGHSHFRMENGHSCLNFPTTIGHASAHSKRKRFIRKLKRWVERNDKEKHGTERQSLPWGPDEAHAHPRKSYSSA